MISRNGAILSKRANATAAAVRSIEEKVSKLPNGLTVASVDLGGATSQLMIAFRAGSRYEGAGQKGLVHHVRNMVGTPSEKFHGTALLWNTALNGGHLKATSTRDVFAVEMGIVRENFNIGLSLLGELAHPKYEPYHVEDQLPFIKSDNVHKCAEAVAIEDLHKAAYRSGPLGNSSYAAKSQIGTIKYNQLQQFSEKYFCTENSVVVGVNVDHEQLVTYASQYCPINEGPAVTTHPSKFFGGEVRRETASDSVVVALVGEGSSLSSVKEIAVQSVLAQLIAAIKIGNVTAKPLSVQYVDSGLVGTVLSGHTETIGAAVKQLASSLKGLKAGDKELAIAKKKAALSVLLASESANNVALDTAVLLLANNGVSPSEISEAIINVTTAEVTSAITKLNSKYALAVNGNLSNVPYVDEL